MAKKSSKPTSKKTASKKSMAAPAKKHKPEPPPKPIEDEEDDDLYDLEEDEDNDDTDDEEDDEDEDEDEEDEDNDEDESRTANSAADRKVIVWRDPHNEALIETIGSGVLVAEDIVEVLKVHPAFAGSAHLLTEAKVASQVGRLRRFLKEEKGVELPRLKSGARASGHRYRPDADKLARLLLKGEQEQQGEE